MLEFELLRMGIVSAKKYCKHLIKRFCFLYCVFSHGRINKITGAFGFLGDCREKPTGQVDKKGLKTVYRNFIFY